MHGNLAIVTPALAIWLAAALAAQRLPHAGSARSLIRNAALLRALTVSGLVMLLGVGFTVLASASPTDDQLLDAIALAGVPALVVAFLSTHRLRHLRAAGMVFSTAPRTPTPPALRAAAAHPMVVVPVQLTAIALVAGSVTETVRLPNAQLTVPAITAAAVVATAVSGVYHALRHSRLVEEAVPLSPRAARVLRVQQLQDRPSGFEPAVEPLGARRVTLGRQLHEQATQDGVIGQ